MLIKIYEEESTGWRSRGETTLSTQEMLNDWVIDISSPSPLLPSVSPILLIPPSSP
jgi:hypothetical protein